MFRRELQQILHDAPMRCRLEVEPQAELHFAHERIVRQAIDPRASLAINASTGVRQVRMVEHVKGLRTELNPDLLTNGNSLDNRQIAVEPLGTDDHVALRVAETGQARSGRRRTRPRTADLPVRSQRSGTHSRAWRRT